MTAVPALLLLGLVLATVVPRLLTRAAWPAREPVLGLWVWQCLIAAVLLCCGLALLFSLTAAWPAARAVLFSGAPRGVAAAYGTVWARQWAAAGTVVLAVGGFRTLLALAGEVRAARAQHRRRRRELAVLAPDLPPGLPEGRGPRERERLVVLEDVRPEAWSLPGSSTRLVVTTGALRRLNDRELAAVLAHERGHVRARHHWLLPCAEALGTAFPGARLFSAFREETGRLVELAADDAASRRHGRLAVALALLELNEGRGGFGGCPRGEVDRRVDRLLAGEPRLPVGHRLRLTAAAAAVPAVPVLLAFAPGLHALL